MKEREERKIKEKKEERKRAMGRIRWRERR